MSLQRCIACALYTVSGTFERKLPLIAKNTLTSPSNIACSVSTVSYPHFRGGSKLNSFPSASRKGFGRTLPHTHGAVTLDIRVSAHTYGACSGAPHMSANQQKIHDHRDIVDAVALLGNAQAPRDDRLL